MQRCNNCGTINEIGVEKCIQCNMKGNFTPILGGKPATVEVKTETIICRNCGSSTPLGAKKCGVCHFPVPVNILKTPNSDLQNLKVG